MIKTERKWEISPHESGSRVTFSIRLGLEKTPYLLASDGGRHE
jgi:hypothetical protein